jgi:hypothetical protein
MFLTGRPRSFSFVKQRPLLRCRPEPNSEESHSLWKEKQWFIQPFPVKFLLCIAVSALNTFRLLPAISHCYAIWTNTGRPITHSVNIWNHDKARNSNYRTHFENVCVIWKLEQREPQTKYDAVPFFPSMLEFVLHFFHHKWSQFVCRRTLYKCARNADVYSDVYKLTKTDCGLHASIQVYCKIHFLWKLVRGSIVGWGTMLQAGR